MGAKMNSFWCEHGKWWTMCLTCNPPDHLVPTAIESDEALEGFTREELEDLERFHKKSPRAETRGLNS